MKPITCVDIEPILIEYFSSADDVELAQSNQQVPQLVLAHIETCQDCASQYSGFLPVLREPVNVALPDKHIQAIPHLSQCIEEQVAKFRHLLSTDEQDFDHLHDSSQAVAQRSAVARPWQQMLATWPARWVNLFALPQAGFAAVAASLLVAVLLLWQPQTQYQQNSVAFQAQLDITPQSVEYVYGMNRAEAPKPWMAFTSSQAQFNPFLIGNFYSESVALYLQQNAEASVAHLDQFADYLARYPSLRRSKDHVERLSQHLSKASRDNLTKSEALKLFSAFPSIYKNEVAKMTDDKTLMFDFGSWVIDLNLAALANYQNVAKEKDNLLYFNQRVKSLGLPSGVVQSLNQIDKLLHRDRLEKKEFQQLFSQGMNLKNQLG